MLKVIYRLKASKIYLVLASISLLVMQFFPVFVVLQDDIYMEIFLNGTKVTGGLPAGWVESFPYIYIHISLCVFTVAILFMGKKLRVQSGMIRLSYLLFISYLLLLYFNLKPNGEEVLVGYRGFYLPLISMTFLFLANRSIKQEMKVIELLDSLREKKGKK